ncbi:GtrA family protein [Paenibacillus chibensis]|uniref:GtrA family protein n=1 Tax=Paenibacillus chibensis TaxID=59846 RepID=UPI001FE80D7A|nr:GtrA family protein [Paenibacillus chibensis]MEC0369746.1 GtrA family protein [Paenibacillus chibensis]
MVERSGHDELKRFIRFGIVGVSNTLVDFIVFFLVHSLLGSIVGQIVSYAAGMLNSYILNRRWTFGQKHARDYGQMLRFIAVNAVIAAGTALLLSLMDKHLPLVAAKLLVTAAGVFINYFVSRTWVFRPKHAEEQTEIK